MEKVGEGLSCSAKKDVIGELVYIRTIEDVISLFDNAKGKICIVDDAGITTLSPILPELEAALCTTGGAGSHLSIVSREFGIPCIMALQLSMDNIHSLNGRQAKIVHDGDEKGYLYLID